MLSVKRLHAGYGDLTVLRDISFEVSTGGVLAVLGHNGVGKTTLLRCLIGVLRPQSGEVLLSGAPTSRLKPHQIARQGVAYIPQEAPLFADLTVRENLKVAFSGRSGFEAACERTLAPFPFLRERFAQRAGTLSGGEQKMLLLARALLVGPRLILADEVSEGVQPKQIAVMAEVLGEATRSEGTTLVLVEQHIEFALDLAQDYVILKQGRVAAAGPVAGATSEVAAQLSL